MAVYNERAHKYDFEPEGLERDLDVGAKFWRWSLGNGQYLIRQRADLQEAAGLRVWNAWGYGLKRGLPASRQLRLINPRQAKFGAPETEGFESKAVIYDIRDVTADRGAWEGAPRENRSAMLNELARLNGFRVIEAPFAHSTKKEMEVSLERRLIGINRAYHERNSSERFRFLVASGIVLLVLQDEIATNQRVDARDNGLTNKSIACGAAYEICRFLGDEPPTLPMTAKKILCAGGGLVLKEAHEIYARDQIAMIREKILHCPDAIADSERRRRA